MIYTSTLLRWLQRKRYQYEVTFSLYMLTPTEKFIFNSVLFLVLSMVVIAAALYLPEHITMMARRAWFYYAGDESGAGGASGVNGVSGGSGAGGVSGMKDVGAEGIGGKGIMGGDEILDMLGRL